MQNRRKMDYPIKSGETDKEPEEEQKTLTAIRKILCGVLKRFLKNMAGIFLKKRNGWS